ncbi:unnamed protein product [Calicophoron daubneyi]|uniref:RUN domain-containing protein n=1 Tax=Calicophoron daubneyi TaxID=300641 RepID=A0AAV2TT80_CALDB
MHRYAFELMHGSRGKFGRNYDGPYVAKKMRDIYQSFAMSVKIPAKYLHLETVKGSVPQATNTHQGHSLCTFKVISTREALDGGTAEVRDKSVMIATEQICEQSLASSDEDQFPLDEDGRPKERWAPLGANSSPEPSCSTTKEASDKERDVCASELSRLVSENEQMNHVLMALTSHFAQVQFRLGQVVNAESENREEMLKSLEEFASRGIPDLSLFSLSSLSESKDEEKSLPPLRGNPLKLISELRKQLDDLERFAYETGEQKELPTQSVLEKQHLVLEELTKKLALNINNVEQLSDQELRQVVDSAIHQFLDPMKLNEKLVEQLKTQVLDLERFIDFLHGSGACGDALAQALAEFKRTHQLISAEPSSVDSRFESNVTSDVDGISTNRQNNSATPGVQLGHSRHLKTDRVSKQQAKNRETERQRADEKKPDVNVSHERTISVMHRALVILQIFASTFSPDWMVKLKKNKEYTGKKHNSATVERAKAQHWGTLRARLEMAIDAVIEKCELLRSYRFDKSVMASHHSSCIMQPANTGPATHSHAQNRRSVTSEMGSTIKGNRQLRAHSIRPGSFVTENKVINGTFPGSKIALPVQNLHDVNLRLMVNGSEKNSMSSGRVRTGYTDLLKTRIPADLDANLSDTEEYLRAEAHRMLIRAVRRQLCPALRDLIEHGIIKKTLSTIHEEPGGLVSQGSFLLRPILGCLAHRHSNVMEDGFDAVDTMGDEDPLSDYPNRIRHRSGPHAWHILLKFYYTKNGQMYNESPARKLSESFDLDSYGGKAITLRQRFFNAMGMVLESHNAYRRGNDSKFKSFVSIALNERKLVQWLRLVLKNQAFVESIYQPWSYTLSTGFDDALQSLSRLSDLEFDLPYDYNVRHLREIRDAF